MADLRQTPLHAVHLGNSVHAEQIGARRGVKDRSLYGFLERGDVGEPGIVGDLDSVPRSVGHEAYCAGCTPELLRGCLRGVHALHAVDHEDGGAES